MIDRYSTAEMTELWSDRTKLQTWLDVEWAAMMGLGKVGILPTDELQLIESYWPIPAQIDRQIRDREQETRHDVAAFVDVVQSFIPAPADRWVHFGLTSSDIVDTSLNSTLRVACGHIELELLRAKREIEGLRNRYGGRLTVGRTHGRWAERMTMAHRFDTWQRMILRVVDAFFEMQEVFKTGKLAGAIGNHSTFPEDAEGWALHLLGMRAVPGTQVIDRHAHATFLFHCALLGSTVEKIATDIRLLSQQEVEEARERFYPDQKGSSAMPHKRANPVRSEQLCGIARLLRGYVVPGLEDVALWHERDISHSSVERVALPDASQLAHYAARSLTEILRDLEIDVIRSEERALQAPDSHARLLRLIQDGMDRDEAYRLIQQEST